MRRAASDARAEEAQVWRRRLEHAREEERASGAAALEAAHAR